MCDTCCINEDSHILFAKNSDRHPQEVQYTWYAVNPKEELSAPELMAPHKIYKSTSWKALQPVLDAFDHPYPALVSTPAWMWGAEMGVNTKGVAIGNEALFTNTAAPYHTTGLLGMDILRLALHNAASAQEARDLIIKLITTYGQGGNGAYRGTLRYHNAFLITDGRETYIVETAEKHWAWKRILTSTSISNTFTLRRDYDQSDAGTQKAAEKPDFKHCYEDFFYSHMTKGKQRLAYVHSELRSKEASIPSLRELCRSHISQHHPGGMHAICMHPGPITQTATTSSMIIDYQRQSDHCFAWSTCSPYPCSALYLPFPIPSTNEELAQLKKSTLPVGRAAGIAYGSAAREVSPLIASQHKRSIKVTAALQKREQYIDSHTLEWSTLPWKNLIEFSEICYTSSNEMYHEIADGLGRA